MSKLDDLAQDVLRHYPRIYIACHIDHDARRGQGAQISARDQTILAHIPDAGISPRDLAQHLRVGAPTLSAALKRLVELGLASLTTRADDRRGKIAALTQAGKAALAQTSVLDKARVREALAGLQPREREMAVRGLELLANAATANTKRSEA